MKNQIRVVFDDGIVTYQKGTPTEIVSESIVVKLKHITLYIKDDQIVVENNKNRETV